MFQIRRLGVSLPICDLVEMLLSQLGYDHLPNLLFEAREDTSREDWLAFQHHAYQPSHFELVHRARFAVL